MTIALTGVSSACLGQAILFYPTPSVHLKFYQKYPKYFQRNPIQRTRPPKKYIGLVVVPGNAWVFYCHTFRGNFISHLAVVCHDKHINLTISSLT